MDNTSAIAYVNRLGCSLSGPSQFGPSSVGMGPEPEYYPECRTPRWPPQCHSGLAISTLRRFEQLAAVPRSIIFCIVLYCI